MSSLLTTGETSPADGGAPDATRDARASVDAHHDVSNVADSAHDGGGDAPARPADAGVDVSHPEAGTGADAAKDAPEDVGAAAHDSGLCYPLPLNAVSWWRGENNTDDSVGTAP